LVLAAPYDYGSIGFGGHKKRAAVITELKPIAERTVQLTLNWQDRSESCAVEFEPGQFVELEIPGTGVKRAYSLANIPNWRGEMVFLIRLQLGGMFSGYLTDKAAPGEILDVHEAAGAFTLQAGSLTPAIFIAGGTGLAPFLSMLSRLAEWGEDRSIHLLFGVNQENELFYLDELQALQQQLPSFSFELCVWKPVGEWAGFTGTPADALEQYLQQNGNGFEVYLCGPPKLVQAATAIAHHHGIGEEKIFAENFV
jgi:ferredoxin-NADP reductase